MVWENGIWHNESKQKTPSNILNKNPMHSCSGPQPLAKFKTDAPTAELRKKKKADAMICDKTPAVVTIPEPTSEEEKSRKRKWELVDGNSNTLSAEISDTAKRSADQSLNVVKSTVASATCIEETLARDALMDLPFPKMLPYWKFCESSDGFKSVPQRPHFRPLLESIDDLDLRESAAVGMMVTFYDLLKEVKGLKLDVSASRLNYLRDAFARLDKNGFEVEAYQAVISKVLSLKDVRAKKEEEQKCFEDSIKEEESGSLKLEELRLELQGKISKLERQDAVAKMKKEAAEKKIAEMKAHVGMISREIEDVEVEFQKTISAPW
ncbi:Agenet domain-containing protein [Raphanus sativus]|nr:Agenet domain-containing protein [Raphanus sativus]